MRLTTLALASISALSALAVACGGGGPGTGPVSPTDAEDGCRRDCEHAKTCDPTSPETVEACTASCVSDVQGWLRADAFEAIVDCRTALACTASSETCGAECAPTSTHEAYETQCRKVFAPCGTADQLNGACETTPVAGTSVGFFCLITPSIMDEMIACIPDGTACDAGIQCIQDVLNAHHIDA